MHADGCIALEFPSRSPGAITISAALECSVSDTQFTNGNRIPFRFRSLVREHLTVFASAQDWYTRSLTCRCPQPG